MWVRLGSTDLMAGKVMFLRSNQGDRLDGNESVADSFRSDLVGFKSWSATILGAFYYFFVCQKKPPQSGSAPATRGQSHPTAKAGSDVVQSGRPIFDDFFQHVWPYIGNNTANGVFQMVKRLWLIRMDQ
ncbi:hypothetical protein TNCV_4757582 [Trichonephila clavipes]|nr:hypothetical protein TNCV_4757582 [Trichonephila clavipes]